MRTLKLALENCIGRKLGADSCVIPWLIEHTGKILSLFEVGSDGNNPYHKLRGKKMKQPLVEFGESVHFLIPDHGSLGKMQSKWRNGIYLGIRMESSEILVGNSEGMLKVRSIKRKPDGQMGCRSGMLSHRSPMEAISVHRQRQVVDQASRVQRFQRC